MSTFTLPDRRLRIAFFGTPEIAATMLRRLITKDADDVVLVVCQPDRPQGRGRQVRFPAVKAYALKHGLEVVQPTRLKDGTVAGRLRELAVDLAIVVAYGRILPTAVFEAPAFHTWNVHASVLPRHRGAAPIQHAILAGDDETGVTLMQLSEGMDEGDMLLVRRIPLHGTETAEVLSARLGALGAEALVEGLDLAKTGGLTVVAQDDDDATYAPRIQKSEGLLDLRRPADALERQVRAFFPWPGTFVPFGDGPLKIRSTHALDGAPPKGEIGHVTRLDPLTVQTGRGQLVLNEVQPPGKKPMDGASFVRGAGRALRIGSPLSDSLDY